MRALKWTETQKAEDIVSDPIPASAALSMHHLQSPAPARRCQVPPARNLQFEHELEIKSKYEYVLIWFVLTDAGPKYEPATRQQ